MSDHNSPTKAMRAVYCAFLYDIESITGISTHKDRRRITAMDRRPLLSFLAKHHEVFLSFLGGRYTVSGVKNDGTYPVFLRELWARAIESDDLVCVSLLRQATCLLRKWAEDSVPLGESSDLFISRMLAKNQFPVDLVDEIALELPHLIGEDDLRTDELPMPKITSGARRDRTPVLCRLDTIQRFTLTRDIVGVYPIPVDGAPVNRLVEVPKDWSKNRLVFAESTERMNLQQVLREVLEQRVFRSRAGRRHISFDDQGQQHRRLSQDGVSTIDLSDASDWVTAPMIWRFLRKYPVLRAALFAARSTTTTVVTTEVSLRCFGTMGNATTFPVMTIFLAALARVAEDCCRSRGARIRPSTVFGDDVIVDDAAAGTVVDLMSRCGLQVNRKKTYIARCFKESCGVDLYRGQDITPVYVKRIRVTQLSDATRVIDQANALHRRGLWKTASCLLSFFPEGSSLPVNTNDALHLESFCSGSENPSRGIYLVDEQRWLSLAEAKLRQRRVRVKRRDSHLDLHYTLARGARITDTKA